MANTNRTEVLQNYQSTWKPLRDVQIPFEWTPGTCTYDDLTVEQRDSILRGVNYLRDLVGSPPVTDDANENYLAQEAAFVLGINGYAQHYVPPEFECYSKDADLGAQQSLWSLGGAEPWTPAQQPWLLFDDGGIENLGHREAMISPAMTTVGIGTVGNLQLIHLGGSGLGRWPGGPGLAWPAAGYFPEQLAPTGTSVWSFHTLGYEDRRLNRAHVAVKNLTVPSREVTVEPTVRTRGLIGFLPKGVVFPSDLDGRDVTYRVTVSGIMGAQNTALPDVIYDVTLINGEMAAPEPVTWTSQPSVSGAPIVGRVLTADPGIYAPNASDAVVTYQWFRGATQVGTGDMYNPTTQDIGSPLTLRVIVSHPDFEGRAQTTTATVTDDPDNPPPSATRAPAIMGTLKVGNTLATDIGEWNQTVDATGYQWFSAEQPIPGATTSTYTLAPRDAGNRITVSVTVANETGRTNTAMSARTESVDLADAPVVASPVVLSGTARVGKTLTAKGFSFTPSTPGRALFQWYADGRRLSGAAAKTARYIVPRTLVGRRLTVTVRWLIDGYSPASTTSAPTKPIAR